MENFSIPLLKKSFKFIKNHKGISAAALTGAVIAAILIKKKNKSNYDLRTYGINKK